MVKTKGICQYCKKRYDNNERRRTAEHIIPYGIIELFPEQYISFFEGKKFIDNRSMTIADVCEKCNGTLLSPLDNYGKNLINNNFLSKIPVDKKEEEFPVEFDYYKLTRWILKILYNYQRLKKENTEWFKRALGYMLHDIRVENISFSMFAGVHINNTPLPEEFYTYKPLQIIDSPKLLVNSLGIVTFGIDPYINSVTVSGAFATYCIRFGSLIVYTILWEKDIDPLQEEQYNKLMTHEFDFKRIVSNKSNYNLKSVSAHSNTSMGYWHLISKSGISQDNMIVKNSIHGQSLSDCQKYFYDSKGEEGMAKTRALVEMLEFPNNERIKRKYEKCFGKDEDTNSVSEKDIDSLWEDI
jgi:hypothetical protein